MVTDPGHLLCAGGCGATAWVARHHDGRITDDGARTLRLLGWRWVATVGVLCPACQRREPPHERTTLPQVCAGCGATFRPHPVAGGALCDRCCPW